MKRFVFVFILVAKLAIGQNYEADSVYYTPIPTPPQKSPVKGVAADDLERMEPHYFFALRSGVLLGCKSCYGISSNTIAASTIHGIKFLDTWSFGVGMGYNSYTTWEVMPVFGSMTLDIGRRNKFFMELNWGGGKVWAGKIPERWYGFEDAKAGRMIQPSLGYKIAYHDLRISLLVGYLSQRVKSTYEYPTSYWDDGFWVAGQPSRENITTTFNRMTIQMGIGWR